MNTQSLLSQVKHRPGGTGLALGFIGVATAGRTQPQQEVPGGCDFQNCLGDELSAVLLIKEPRVGFAQGNTCLIKTLLSLSGA